jgi:hypothetical protein
VNNRVQVRNFPESTFLMCGSTGRFVFTTKVTKNTKGRRGQGWIWVVGVMLFMSRSVEHSCHFRTQRKYGEIYNQDRQMDRAGRERGVVKSAYVRMLREVRTIDGIGPDRFSNVKGPLSQRVRSGASVFGIYRIPFNPMDGAEVTSARHRKGG